MWYRQGAEKHILVVSIGFVEVLPDSVTVLAQVAERAEDLDQARAEAGMKRAEEVLSVGAARDRFRARAAAPCCARCSRCRRESRARAVTGGVDRPLIDASNLAALFRYRGLIQTLVVRDLKARYRGSVLGFFWSFFNPLLLLLIYSFVFTQVLVGAHPIRRWSRTRCSCSAASCRGRGSRRRCSSRRTR